MFAWLGRRPRALGWLLAVLAGFSSAAAAPPTEDQLRAWIRDLNAESFAAREAAAEKLASAGQPAAALLSECVTSGHPESAWRASAAIARIRKVSPDRHVGPDGPAGPEPPTDAAQCNDEPQAPAPNPTQPPSPEPPPDSDIAQALAPPPEPLPLEAVTDQVRIADAYVSPELAPDSAPTEATPPPARSRPALAQASVPRTNFSTLPPRPAPRAPDITFVRSTSTRPPLASTHENQPRLINILLRARTVLGFNAR